MVASSAGRQPYQPPVHTHGVQVTRLPLTTATGEPVPKYLNTPVERKGEALYGLDQARGRLSHAVPVLVEGPLDVLAVTLASSKHTAVAAYGTHSPKRRSPSSTAAQARAVGVVGPPPAPTCAALRPGPRAAGRAHRGEDPVALDAAVAAGDRFATQLALPL